MEPLRLKFGGRLLQQSSTRPGEYVLDNITVWRTKHWWYADARLSCGTVIEHAKQPQEALDMLEKTLISHMNMLARMLNLVDF